MRQWVTAGLCCAVLIVMATPASAATRFASPTGDASAAATCPQSDPCDINTAVEDISVQTGDVIIVLQGIYNLGAGELVLGDAATIRGASRSNPPLITSVSVFPALDIIVPGAVVQDLRITSTGTPFRSTVSGVFERLRLILSGPSLGSSTAAWLGGGALLSDSVAWNSEDEPGGQAILTSGSGAQLRNVTAIASSVSSDGVFVCACQGEVQRVGIRSSIVRGTMNGIRAIQNVGGMVEPDDIDVNVSFSNISSVSEEPPEADVIPGPGNQSAPPLFANALTGDFHQVPGSPTVNAGSPDGLGGSLDFEGHPRVMRGRIDIGADELPDSCFGKVATIVGTAGRDVLKGTGKADVFLGLGGNDLIRGLGGSDRACAGARKDRVIGGAGRDRLKGEAGRDVLKGGTGRDKLVGGAGKDQLLGGPDRDKLQGGPGKDLQRQ